MITAPCYIRIRDYYINLESISSIVAYCPYDFEGYMNNKSLIRTIRSVVGKTLGDKYFEWYSHNGGGYHYKYGAANEHDIFIYEITYNRTQTIYITVEQFKNLSKLLPNIIQL